VAMRKNKEMLERLLKQEIVDTVLALIREGESLTMEEVARRCGVAKGTLYNYFQNKEELLSHVHQAVLGPLVESHQKIFSSANDPLVKLHQFIDAVYGTSETLSTYFRFVWQNKTAEMMFRERVNLVLHPLARICQEGIARSEFVKVDPYLMAEMIFGTVIGPFNSLPYRESEGGSHLDKTQMKQDVKKLIDRIVL